MRGFVIVPPDKLDDRSLREWIAMATAYVSPMPPKAKKPAKARA